MRDPLIFVHGVSHGGWCWEEHFAPFFRKQGYDCYSLNLEGHETPGSKKSINHISLADYVRNIEEAAAKLGRPPILIGHSMGGLVVQKYLENASCKKVILVAPIPPMGSWKASLRFAYHHPNGLLDLMRLNLYAAFYKNAHALMYSADMEVSLLESYKEKMCAESFKAYLQTLFPRIRMKRQKETPMLVIGAGNDHIFTVKEIEETGRFYEAETVIFENMAHNLMLEKGHEQVADYILRWLEKSLVENEG
ncbi:MAG: alpha/beta fold hydrolase [Bacteroidota bacterium]